MAKSNHKWLLVSEGSAVGLRYAELDGCTVQTRSIGQAAPHDENTDTKCPRPAEVSWTRGVDGERVTLVAAESEVVISIRHPLNEEQAAVLRRRSGIADQGRSTSALQDSPSGSDLSVSQAAVVDRLATNLRQVSAVLGLELFQALAGSDQAEPSESPSADRKATAPAEE